MPLIRALSANTTIEDGTRSDFNVEKELLRNTGVLGGKRGIEDKFLDIMTSVGLDPDSILSRIAIIMDSGESDSVKLQAARLALALHMHPAIVNNKKTEEQTRPVINFNIQSPQVNMQNVLSPNGDQKLESW